MNVAIEELSSVRKRVKIEVPANRVAEAFEKLTDDFQKAVNIPGFRPGHAPRAMVQKRYLKEIEDELRRTLVPTAYQEAVKNKNLHVVSQPQIEDLKYQKGLSLSFSTLIEVAPDFQLPTYKALTVSNLDTTVQPAEVEEAIASALEQRSDFVEVTDRTAQTGDFAIINFKAEVDGKPLGEVVPDARNVAGSEGFWLWLKDDMFLPGFVNQVLGQAIGETRTVQVVVPPDFPNEALRSMALTYQVELLQLKVKTLPELTDALSQELFETDVEGLRKRVLEHLQLRREDEVQQQQKREIVEQLMRAATFELPPSLVEEETQDTMYSIVSENQARGIDLARLEEKKEEIYGNAHRSAQELVKLSFILGRIADEEKIEVTQADISNFILSLAQRQQSPVEKVVESIKKNGTIGKIQNRLLNQKTLDFLLQHAVKQ